MTLKVAILGRPNVGKSTLFNRLAGKRLAIVGDKPGVTRDWQIAIGKISDLSFEIIDTAGLEDSNATNLEIKMRKQTERAVEESNVALFLIDARTGVTPVDNHFANWIRKKDIPVILIANKCEGGDQPGLNESFGLGLGSPIEFSAEHGEGLANLFTALLPHAEQVKHELSSSSDKNKPLDTTKEIKEPKNTIQMAIVGRPNVGKSSLINNIICDDRLITGSESGITRDPITVEWEHDGVRIKLIDTAGLRRKSKIVNKIENLSTKESYRSIQFAEIVFLVLDGNLMLQKQDLTIARQVIEEGRILVIALNKWDLLTKKKREYTSKYIDERLLKSLPQARGAPVIKLSALTGENVNKLIPTAFKLYRHWNRRISTGILNQWLALTTDRHPPPIKNGRRIKLRYLTQAKTRPPTFVVFSSRGNELPESYRRFLVNGIRDDFEMPGVPIRLLIRKGKNPYTDF